MENRERKYRAWNPKLNKMEYDVWPTSNDTVGKWLKMLYADEWQFHDLGQTKVILEQYTGLKDKNGVEDWINDIVKAKVGQVTYYRPIYQAESGAYCISLPTRCSTGESGIMICTIPHENVGNIHQNPGLINSF